MKTREKNKRRKVKEERRGKASWKKQGKKERQRKQMICLEKIEKKEKDRKQEGPRQVSGGKER